MVETSSCGMGGTMVTDVALEDVQVIVLRSPALMVVVEAMNVAPSPCGVGVGDGPAATNPLPHPVTNIPAASTPQRPAPNTRRKKLTTALDPPATLEGLNAIRVASMAAMQPQDRTER